MILPQSIHCECSFEMHLHSTTMSRNSVSIVRIVERIRCAFFVEACRTLHDRHLRAILLTLLKAQQKRSHIVARTSSLQQYHRDIVTIVVAS